MTIKKFMWLDILILTIWGIIMDVIAYTITTWIASSSMSLPIMESVFIAPSFTIIYLIYHRWQDKGFIANGAFLILHLILYRAQIFRSYEFVCMIIMSYAVFLLTMYMTKYARNIKSGRWLYHLIAFNILYILMFLVEFIVGVTLGVEVVLLGVVTRHLINLLICSFIVIIMAIQNNLITNMKLHLINSKKEEEL